MLRHRDVSKPASLRQLKLFETIGRHGNLTRAAQECGVSQPAASQAIMALNGIIGLPLLQSLSTGTSLTAHGRQLHQRLAPLLREFERTLGAHGIANPEQVLWHVSFSRLKMLRRVLQHGTLEAASASLAIPKQTLSRNIRELEQRLGFSILIRDGGAVALSGTAASLARHAGACIDEIEWAITDIREMADRDRTKITLGVAPDPGTASLNGVVKSHLDRRPTACLELIEADQDELFARLACGELDLVICHLREPLRPDIEWHLLATISFRIVARKGHPLAGPRCAPLRDLAGQSWALGARGSQRRAATDLLFAGRSSPNCVLVTAAAPLMATVLCDSDCLAMMTEPELATRSDQLCAINQETPNITVQVGWACRAGWTASSLHRHIIADLQTRFGGAAV